MRILNFGVLLEGCPNPRRLEVRRPSYVKSQTHIPNQLGVVSSFSNQAKARKMDHYIDRASTSMNKMHSEKGVDPHNNSQ